MDTIFDDDLEENSVSVETAPEPKRKSVWDMPCVLVRDKAMDPRIEYAQKMISANADFINGQWRVELYRMQEEIAKLENPEDGNAKIPHDLIKQRKSELREHKAKQKELDAQNKITAEILNDQILRDNRWYEQRELGPKAAIVGASLLEVPADKTAYDEDRAAIPLLKRQIRLAARKAGYRSADEMKADVRAQREIAAARFWKNFRLGGFPLTKPKRGNRNIPAMMMTGDHIPGVGNIEVPVDPLAFLAAFFPEKFDEAVKRKIDEVCERNGIGETDDARADVAALRKRLWDAEVREEQQIRAHDAIKVFLPRRQDANLQIVFDYRKK